ncbi:CBM35 domain-containing protein [Cohnella luojiensis]|nr:CBM35 domain-containing protein [Cohnella luojiensis]
MPRKTGNKLFIALMVFALIMAIGWPSGSSVFADVSQVYEAEAAGNTLTGNATVANCTNCSGGQKVGGLYKVDDSHGSSLQMNDIAVSEAGTYKITVYYTSGDPRSINISVNGGAKELFDFPQMPDWETVGSYEVELLLNAGNNVILFDDNIWYAPDIDRIVVGAKVGGGSGSNVYEAEAAGNTLGGRASVNNCAPCSGGQKVGNLFKTDDNQASFLQINNVSVNEAGTYKVTVYYISGDPRSANISVNGGAKELFDFPAMPDWETVGSYDVELHLIAGTNTILFDDNVWYAPDIDRIVVGEKLGGSTDGTVYEAEAAVNTLTGNAAVSNCGPCSGGKKVGNLFKVDDNHASALQFNNVTVSASGGYIVKVYYISGDPRSANISVNGGAKELFDFPATADWNTVGSYEVELHLNAGSNTILFDDNVWYAPDIDRIAVRSADSGQNPGGDSGSLGTPLAPVNYGKITVTPYSMGMQVTNGQYTASFFSESGYADYAWNDGQQLKGVFGKIKLNGEDLETKGYTTHTVSAAQITKIHDDFGKGIQVVFQHTQAGKPTLNQVYSFYDKESYFLSRLDAVSESSISTNYLAPLVITRTGGAATGKTADNRVLFVPFDNDAWIRFKAQPMNRADTSYEVTAIYDNTSRQGLVVGSVTHDRWKTGIDWKGSNNQMLNLTVYGGASSSVTHDSQPHGSLSGTTVTSPTLMVGGYADYREGMEEYGRANTIVAPALKQSGPVPEGVPVGWNSWGAYQFDMTVQDIIDTSNYFKENLKNFDNKGTVYINTDASAIPQEQLKQAVDVIHANGQKAGVYTAPFTHWDNDLSLKVPGTNDLYTYGDIILRDSSGNPLPKLDGAYPLDPSHPGTKMNLKYYFDIIKAADYDFVKMDFLTHGSLEGVHYDPNITTGIQAYNDGMRYINELVDGTMFLSESIAPLFPSQYAHSRRIATDTFGSIRDTEYQLNALTYGWWQDGTIYNHTDPDHIALGRSGSLTEARSRVNSAVISGTVFLDSSNVNDPVVQGYMSELYTNNKIIKLATNGEAFRPVEGNTGSSAADTFVLKDGGHYYLAVFNYNVGSSVLKTVDLARAGLPAGMTFEREDLWTGDTDTVSETMALTLQPAESKLFKLTKLDD